MEAKKLKEILDKHLKWIRGDGGGERADLSGADLSGADLSGANLYGANLYGAYIELKLVNKFFPICCPEYGSFIAWKKAGDKKHILPLG